MGVFKRGNGILYLQIPNGQQRSTGLRDTPANREKAQQLYDEVLRRLDDATRPKLKELTVATYAERWLAETKRSRDDETRIYEYALPSIGDMPLRDVRVIHIERLVKRLVDEGHLSNRSILHVYSVLRVMFKRALREELIDRTPCTLGKDELPKKVDKDPEWRANARLSQVEAEALISCPDIPPDRRVFYSILLFTGARPGEVIPLRWSHLLAREPLKALLLPRGFDTKNKVLKEHTKTEAAKTVPVHPELERVLDDWRMRGWAARFDREPTDDDLIVPKPRDSGHQSGGPTVMWDLDAFRAKAKGNPKATRERLRYGDFGVAGVPHRHQLYETRATFITMATENEMIKDVASQWTHRSPEETPRDGYSRVTWKVECREMLKCPFRVREPRQAPDDEADPLTLPLTASQIAEITAEKDKPGGSATRRVYQRPRGSGR